MPQSALRPTHQTDEKNDSEGEVNMMDTMTTSTSESNFLFKERNENTTIAEDRLHKSVGLD